MAVYSRISARKGSVVRLNVRFNANGVPMDPYAIRRINIYQNSAVAENLVAQIDVVPPDDPSYPAPLVNVGGSSGDVGEYYYDLEVPDTFIVPDSYVDKWFYIGDELTASSGSEIDIDDETLWESQCLNFYIVAASTWYLDDDLIVPRFGFESLDKDFTKPEVRTLEVGIMPLPLYDYDFCRIAPMMAMLQATITITGSGGNCDDLVVDGAPMTMGIRQGTHRSDPFVFRYKLDTSALLRGNYNYKITVQLPNGETRISPQMSFTVR